MLFVGHDSGAFVYINVHTKEVAKIHAHTHQIRCVVSGEPGVAITCSRDNTIKMWKLDTSVCLARFACGNIGKQIAYIPKHKTVFYVNVDYTTSRSNLIRINTETNDSGIMYEHNEIIRSCVVVDDYTVFLSSMGYSIILIDLRTCNHREVKGHTQNVNGVAVAPNNNFVSVSNDGTMRIWGSTGKRIQTTNRLKRVATLVAISDDGKYVATVSPTLIESCLLTVFDANPVFSHIIVSDNPRITDHPFWHEGGHSGDGC